MYVAHVGLVLCDSYKCKFKGFCAFISYKRKIKKGNCKDCNIYSLILCPLNIGLKCNAKRYFIYNGPNGFIIVVLLLCITCSMYSTMRK